MGLGQGDRGYAMAALLVSMSIMAVMMTVAMPVWTQYVKREKEEELIWRGQQYARAVGLFQRKYANTFPPSVDVLVEQKFLRKKYKDPITGEDFQPIPATGMPGGGVIVPGGGPAGNQTERRPIGAPPRMTSVGTTGQVGGIGIQGVVSKSTAPSIKIYNGRTKYNEWAFVYMVTSQGIQGGQGGPQPGMPGQPGLPQGMPGMPGQQKGVPVPGQRPGSPTTTPFGGAPRRPDVGQPSPFGTPSPFGPARPGGQQPSRPPRG